ncbi:type III secretion system gatekeeper subunit SctW [Marinomonas mediterranea]|uniref:Type III secretion regulator YopN/LcrE/InvE/MxiC n=1 Tax=Marinomonas mediterranea (strain ATCC 700492 / JCM 21426 / NBRC 103028 / MMB-1) TaxID=717774 RepID=F2JTD7_MARM1|nr:type III secretion system gatekeeper subunit SctW [Marinomonas mediterranea]ADZ90355.1 type III secretion regulator YopN/LcrE/InvE/MxiC [Marinomonas mediterranea MMB-1]WCN16538.1 YopN family type III secretion system gatekeeper subunit [Marinomonas mediterranea MMB-1]
MNIQNTPSPNTLTIPQTAQSTINTTKTMTSPSQPDTSNMEEIATKFSESVERSSKSLEERSVSARPKMRIEKLEKIYQLLTGQGDQQQNDDVKRLLSMSQNALSLKQLLSIANGDPAKADILAQHALLKNKTRNDPNIEKNLTAALTKLHQAHGHEVKAGLNTAPALALFSRNPTQRTRLRNLYYKSISGSGSLATIFDALLSQFEENQFEQGLHTLLRAMTDDLSSKFPSLPRSQLKSVLGDLRSGQQLITTHNSCKNLLQKFQRKEVSNSGMTAPRLTRRLIDLTQNNVYPREIKNMSIDCVGDNPVNVTIFLNAIFPLIKKMPAPLWPDDRSHQNTLNLILRSMTEYTEKEKQHYQSTQEHSLNVPQ